MMMMRILVCRDRWMDIWYIYRDPAGVCYLEICDSCQIAYLVLDHIILGIKLISVCPYLLATQRDEMRWCFCKLQNTWGEEQVDVLLQCSLWAVAQGAWSDQCQEWASYDVLVLLQCSLWAVAQGAWSDQCQEWASYDVLHHRRHLVLGNALCVRSDAGQQELGNTSRFVAVLPPLYIVTHRCVFVVRCWFSSP